MPLSEFAAVLVPLVVVLGLAFIDDVVDSLAELFVPVTDVDTDYPEE